MGTLALHRSHLPFWPLVAVAAIAWLVAWFAAWPVSQWLAFHVLGLESASQLGEAVAFFLFDVPKVLLLLLGIVTLVSFLRSYIPPERVRSALAGRGVVAGTIGAAGFGVLTPFCSCSAVPLFIGFVEAGIPLGVTLAFLISSPLVNEVAIVLLWGLFGFEARLSTEQRLRDAWASTKMLMRRVLPWVVIGIGIGAFIHGYVPTDLIVEVGGAGNPFALPIVVLLAVPLYAGAAGVIPIVEALLDKGLPLGTTLAFMMATVAISLPEFIILRRVARPTLLVIFLAVVVAGILAVGSLFNALGA